MTQVALESNLVMITFVLLTHNQNPSTKNTMSQIKPLLLWIACLLLIATPSFAQEQEGHPDDTHYQRPAHKRLTPNNSVLIYVDYTTGLDNLMNTMPAEVYHNNVEAFTKFNKLFKIPAIILGEETDYYGVQLPAIKANVTHEAVTLDRHTSSGYTKAMAEHLQALGRPNIIIGGISIDNCAMHTSLDLLNAGYNVHVMVDASSTNSRLVEDVAVMRLIQEGAKPVTWLYTMTELGQDWDSEYGPGMSAIVRQHWPASTVGPVKDITPDGAGLENFRVEDN